MFSAILELTYLSVSANSIVMTALEAVIQKGHFGLMAGWPGQARP
jgi:hypothetical protein